MITTSLSFIIVSSAMAAGFDMQEETLPVRSHLKGQVTLTFKEGEFIVYTNGAPHKIDWQSITGIPENVQEAQLKAFFSNGGSLHLNSLGDEEDYSLKAHTPGLGGGWLDGLSGFAFRKVILGFSETSDNDMYFTKGEVLERLRDSLSVMNSERDKQIIRTCIAQIRAGNKEILEEIRYNVNPAKRALRLKLAQK